MKENERLLSDLVVYTKYARYRPDLKRRETWEEIIDRYIAMMLKKYCGEDVERQFKEKKVNVERGSLAERIITNGQYLYDKKVLPSMRACQFAGPAIEKNNARIFNCSYAPIDHYKAFSETMFLLLGGTGMGYSVQQQHIKQLPPIVKPQKSQKYVIDDSIEGWASAVNMLMKAYFGKTITKPRFDYSSIRPKGEQLITAGGKAPGPAPLRICLTKIECMLEEKEDGDKLTSLECHDICCHIADAVLAGGIRRAALISFFSFGDMEMATCKSGAWWENNPQRGRANNSVMMHRDRVTEEEFKGFFNVVRESGSGEPGFYWTNDDDMEYGSNPCCEISLAPDSFCNLTEVNAGNVEGQEDFNTRVRVAAFFGTLQAGFTDFHLLRNSWQRVTERDALVGVGLTGICNGRLDDLDLTQAAKTANEENEKVAEEIGINKAARVTTVKPSGSTSSVLGVSSGIHEWYSPYYIRNMQCRVDDDLYNFFTEHHPELIKVMDLDPQSAVIGCPMKAPEGALLREDQTAIDFLERVKKYNVEYVREGHRSGPNTNNVSATCSVKENEWSQVRDWMWDNREYYNGISLLPYDGGTYKDAPFQECDEQTYLERLSYTKGIDLTKISEAEDNTDLQSELACANGACELTY